MGRAKQALLEDDGFADFLQELLDGEALDGTAAGITKKVIDEGVESLSEKQKHVFNTYVVSQYSTSECTRCGNDIPWSEMYAAYDNGGLCNWCEHMSNKDD